MTDPEKAEAHKVYKELVSEINSLANDLVASISIFRAANSEARDDISLLRNARAEDTRAAERRYTALSDKVSKLQADLAALAAQLEIEKDRRRGEMSVKAEDTKGRWAFWVAVVGGMAGATAATVNMLAAWFG